MAAVLVFPLTLCVLSRPFLLLEKMPGEGKGGEEKEEKAKFVLGPHLESRCQEEREGGKKGFTKVGKKQQSKSGGEKVFFPGAPFARKKRKHVSTKARSSQLLKRKGSLFLGRSSLQFGPTPCGSLVPYCPPIGILGLGPRYSAPCRRFGIRVGIVWKKKGNVLKVSSPKVQKAHLGRREISFSKKPPQEGTREIKSGPHPKVGGRARTGLLGLPLRRRRRAVGRHAQRKREIKSTLRVGGACRGGGRGGDSNNADMDPEREKCNVYYIGTTAALLSLAWPNPFLPPFIFSL